jgi:alpha-ketoglutarate-dependent taurine dioxygenase
MALSCIRPAKSGGDSIVVNALRVFSQLSPVVQSFLLRFPFVRQNPYNPESPTPVRRTIFHQVETPFYSGLGIQYHRTRIEGGHRFVGEPLSSEAIHALDTLDRGLYAPDNSHKFLLQSGTILLVNNHVVCHDRTEFEDQAGAPRLLERYWSGEYL